ncbi:hypothetical protein AKJ09_02027 [Labilithrix luteola]|uniref:Uncharacterized protein n=1 Tax=Labilithrix luteola TaxID=1391654 RepID=A0A0K1PPB1_9BACT|nr:hypothetical protein AKJ09_02027 [Labilithrix luteola]
MTPRSVLARRRRTNRRSREVTASLGAVRTAVGVRLSRTARAGNKREHQHDDTERERRMLHGTTA